MINGNLEKKHEDSHYPRIKIYGFASLLADVTTDYAIPMLQSIGMTKQQIEALHSTVRPKIEIYEGDFYGITTEELLAIQHGVQYRLRSNKTDAHSVFFILQRLSAGRRRFMWIPGLAWDELSFYLIRNDHNPEFIDKSTYESVVALYRRLAGNPEQILTRRYAMLNSDWDLGKRSRWDNDVNELIFAPLGARPDVLGSASSLMVRTFAEKFVSEYDVSARTAFEKEIYAILSNGRFLRPGYSAGAVPSLENVARWSLEEWSELRDDLRSQ